MQHDGSLLYRCYGEASVWCRWSPPAA